MSLKRSDFPERVLILGDGPSYKENKRHWRLFNGDLASIHYYRDDPDIVITADPRKYGDKESKAIDKCRLVIGMSNWFTSVRKERYIPHKDWDVIEWGWCTEARWTSGVFAIEWAVKEGYKEIYTVGIDLTTGNGYNRNLEDPQTNQKMKIFLKELGTQTDIYKLSEDSELPYEVRDPFNAR